MTRKGKILRLLFFMIIGSNIAAAAQTKPQEEFPQEEATQEEAPPIQFNLPQVAVTIRHQDRVALKIHA